VVHCSRLKLGCGETGHMQFDRRMSQLGQSLPKRDARVASVYPSTSDMILRRREGRNGPDADIRHGVELTPNALRGLNS